jgi:DNA-directed RNA polymerase subunit RPC12/RpoP
MNFEPQLKQFTDFLVGLLEPPKRESVVQWCEHNVEVPTGAIRGRLNMKMAPYGREILERFGERKTKSITMCFASQSAKTTITILGMLYRLVKDAQDAMWVFPNRELGNSFSKARWMKFVQGCPPASQLLPRTSKNEIDRHLFAFMEQHFLTMFLKFVGSNSPANLASFPCGILVMDECDKYGDQSKYEAAALDLAEERTKTFPFPLVVKASTPTTAERMIWPAFLKSDQRYFWLPCPRCSQSILLRFRVKSERHGDCGLRWWRESEEEVKTNGEWDVNKVQATAFYRCQECGGEIQDFERTAMLEQGQWRPSNEAAESGDYGYHLSSLYSILSQKTSFGAIAGKWIVAKGILSGRQNFINSWLAETWDAERMFDLTEVVTESYTLQDVPKEAVAILTVDVQEGHFWAVVRRWAPPSKEKPNGESWLLFADRVETADQLEALQKEHGVMGENVLLDLAHRPNQTGQLIISKGWRGIWGSDTKQFWHPQPNGTRLERIFSVVQLRDPHLGTAWEARTPHRVRYVKFSTYGAMDLVASLRYTTPTIWHITANTSEKYQRHLNSRMKMLLQNKRTGRMEPIWKQLHQDDHLLDCEEFQVIRAIQVGLISLPAEKIEVAA